ncbi:MAG: ribonuclease HI family protein, partial [Clostridia bacterium]|nr:ribonuclease HI family protein [Clostridia bacterium]
VKEALKAAKSLGAEEVVLYLDSELVVKQLNGEYRVRSPGLTSLYEEVIGLASTFLSFSVQHVGRDKNKRADRLANLALARGG